MPVPHPSLDVYLEITPKRAIASAVDWPGFTRVGRDEESALQALVGYGPRYAKAIRDADPGFAPPADVSALRVVERLKGNASTDYGVPSIPPASDTQPLPSRDLARMRAILEACWRYFDSAARKAGARPLRKGPRGGGRELEEIIRHDADAEGGYVSMVSFRMEPPPEDGLRKRTLHVRRAVLAALEEAAPKTDPGRGPRGGLRWTARTFVRRTAWHTLDHAWEIEDRSK